MPFETDPAARSATSKRAPVPLNRISRAKFAAGNYHVQTDGEPRSKMPRFPHCSGLMPVLVLGITVNSKDTPHLKHCFHNFQSIREDQEPQRAHETA